MSPAEARVIQRAQEYEAAWDRYANPSNYPDAGTPEARILAKGHAHQNLLVAVRQLRFQQSEWPPPDGAPGE